MVDARSLRTMAAPLQNEMKERATVVATTTFAVTDCFVRGVVFNNVLKIPFAILRS